MKKLYFTILTFLATGAIYALPVGNPAEASLLSHRFFYSSLCYPEWYDSLHLRAGFYGDYAFNSTFRNTAKGNRAYLDHAKIDTNALYLAINWEERVDLFATIGMSTLFLEGNLSTFAPVIQIFNTSAGARFSLETSTELSWSIGGRATIWRWGCWSLGMEGQYFTAKPRVKRLTYDQIASTYYANASPYFRTEFQEWQAGLGIAYHLNHLVPYVAVKWSEKKLGWQNKFPSKFLLIDDAAIITLNDLRTSKHWGFAIGGTLLDCKRSLVTVEGRFANEKALYVNAQICF